MPSDITTLAGFSGTVSPTMVVSEWDCSGGEDHPVVFAFEAVETKDVSLPDVNSLRLGQGSSASSSPTDLAAEFNKLAEKWYSDTARQSSVEEMVLHPAYQQIIGMGTDALPFVLRELKRTRAHWLWALAMIVRDDHAKPGQSFREAVDSWLEWGRSERYL